MEKVEWMIGEVRQEVVKVFVQVKDKVDEVKDYVVGKYMVFQKIYERVEEFRKVVE